MATIVSLPAGWTLPKLKRLTRKERYQLLQNVQFSKLLTDEATVAFVEVIEASGPHHDSVGLADADPLSMTLHDIINSTTGEAACIAATEAGYPALAGVEPFIIDRVGEAYGKTYHATAAAGDFVAKLMRRHGYDNKGQRAMPPGSVARSAAFWERVS